MKVGLGWSVHIFVITALCLMGCGSDPAGVEEVSPYAWKVSTPEKQGLDGEVLGKAFAEAGKREFINSLLVVRNGCLVGERYYNGLDRDDAHNVRSVSKSFLSALVGIALEKDFILTLDQQALGFFPEYATREPDSRRKRLITLRNLLQMRAGFDHEQNNYFELYNSDNWIEATIALPLMFNPGEQFSYNTFETHMLSAILTKVTCMSTLEFAEKYLLEPLGISIEKWETDPQGIYFGGNNMFFTTRDMARFGYLYLRGGEMEGRQIVPAEWVKTSTANLSNFENVSWGELKDLNYGYLWWLGSLGRHEVYLAIGHGGQFIINIPALEMIVVTTSDAYVDWEVADQHEQLVLELVANYVLPAVSD